MLDGKSAGATAQSQNKPCPTPASLSESIVGRETGRDVIVASVLPEVEQRRFGDSTAALTQREHPFVGNITSQLRRGFGKGRALRATQKMRTG